MTCLENPLHASFDDNPNIFKHAEEPLSAISAKPFEDIQEFLSVLMIFHQRAQDLTLFLLYYYSYKRHYLVILKSSQTIFTEETTALIYEPAIL